MRKRQASSAFFYSPCPVAESCLPLVIQTPHCTPSRLGEGGEFAGEARSGEVVLECRVDPAELRTEPFFYVVQDLDGEVLGSQALFLFEHQVEIELEDGGRAARPGGGGARQFAENGHLAKYPGGLRVGHGSGSVLALKSAELNVHLAVYDEVDQIPVCGAFIEDTSLSLKFRIRPWARREWRSSSVRFWRKPMWATRRKSSARWAAKREPKAVGMADSLLKIRG